MDRDYEFSEFLQRFSDCFGGKECKVLRFLLSDHLSLSKLAEKPASGMTFFNALETEGGISSTDVNLLSEIAKLTNNKRAKLCIDQYMKVIGDQAASEGTDLSLFRRTLYRCLCEVRENAFGAEQSDLHRLIQNYQLDNLDFTNKWDVVFYLESQKMLKSNNNKDLDRFTSCLNNAAKDRLKSFYSSERQLDANMITSPTVSATVHPGPYSKEVPSKRKRKQSSKTGSRNKHFKKGPSTSKSEVSKDFQDGMSVDKDVEEKTQHKPGGNTETTYRLMLSKVSQEIERRNVSLDMLKFALVDFVSTKTQLEGATSSLDLFLELDNEESIQQQDISLLNALFELLKLNAIKRIIANSGFPTARVPPIDKFTAFRIAAVNFGKKLDGDEIKEIGGVYKVPNEKRPNQWKLLQYLQDTSVIKTEKDLNNLLKSPKAKESKEEPWDTVIPDEEGLYEYEFDKPPEPASKASSSVEAYKMDSRPHKGAAFILNNNFTDLEKERKGSLVDVKNAEVLWKKLGFYVKIAKEKTSTEIMDELKAFLKLKKVTKTDCVVVMLMSHGGEGFLQGVDKRRVNYTDIYSLFTPDVCPEFKGKPKIFFIQACRGKQIDTGVEAGSASSSQNPTVDIDDEIEEEERIPLLADFYEAYSSCNGYYSLRNRVRGSYFVQALCEVFYPLAPTEDLKSLMTMVSQKVSSRVGKLKIDGTKTIIMQQPQTSSTLNKKVYFKPSYKK